MTAGKKKRARGLGILVVGKLRHAFYAIWAWTDGAKTLQHKDWNFPVEYSIKDSINKVEAVQRRAARFATGDCQRTSIVTDRLQQLQWQTLQSRRAYAQIVMMYRIVYNLVDIQNVPAEHHLNRISLRTRGHSLWFLVPHTRTTVYCTGQHFFHKPYTSGTN